MTGLGFGLMYIPAVVAVAEHFNRRRSLAIGQSTGNQLIIFQTGKAIYNSAILSLIRMAIKRT